MSKILVVSGHPRLNQSLANKTILETLKDKGADFTLLRLDEEGFAPQVEKDQALLKDADIPESSDMQQVRFPCSPSHELLQGSPPMKICRLCIRLKAHIMSDTIQYLFSSFCLLFTQCQNFCIRTV